MPTIYGLEDVTRQDGAVLAETGSGVVTFTETLLGRPADVESFYFSLTRRVSTNSDFPGLALDSKNMTWLAGGIRALNLVWGGVNVTGTDEDEEEPLPAPVWVLKRSPTQEPIDTHPDFPIFAGKLGAEVNNAVFNQETGLFEGFKVTTDSTNPFAGIEKFLDGGAVVQKTTAYKRVPSGISTELIPQITKAPGGAPWSIPSGGTRNWLKTDLVITQRGSAFEVFEEWTLSGRRGWNTTIYS